ncbi:MAG: FIST N-terminal domain-containing protein [Desulfuromonadales bacterium]
MSIKTAFSSKTSLPEVVSDLQAQFGDFETNLVVFFASSSFASDEVAGKMAEAFPQAATLGCSTAGEIVTGRMLTNSVVAMAFDKQSIKSAKIAVLENLSSDVGVALNVFEQNFNRPMSEMDPKQYVGLVLIDGLSGKEEQVIDRIGDLTNVNFIGGSAGDDLKFAATYVYANGRSYSNAAVLAMIEPVSEFTFIKTQSFCPLSQKLVVTKANEAAREVLEFNNKPAAVAYAEALGTTVADVSNQFMHNPVGLVFEGEPFVRSPQQIKGDSMFFYCSVIEGMELSLLESTDIISDTKKAIETARQELSGISGIINFNCILRTLELNQKGLSDAYGELFSGAPTIGFSTYGEQFIGHVNQTATMLVFR